LSRVAMWSEELEQFAYNCSGLTTTKSVSFFPCLLEAESVSVGMFDKINNFSRLMSDAWGRCIPVKHPLQKTTLLRLTSESGKFFFNNNEVIFACPPLCLTCPTLCRTYVSDTLCWTSLPYTCADSKNLIIINNLLFQTYTNFLSPIM
jgi:hypothetical protein